MRNKADETLVIVDIRLQILRRLRGFLIEGSGVANFSFQLQSDILNADSDSNPAPKAWSYTPIRKTPK